MTSERKRTVRKKQSIDLNMFRQWISSKYLVSYDIVTHKMTFNDFENKRNTLVVEANTVTYLCQELKKDFDGVSISKIKRYLNVIAGENVKNPLLDSIKSVKWDGVNRLQQVFEILHIEDKRSKIFLYKWFLQAIAMLHNGDSGSRFSAEFILVLQEKQETGAALLFHHLCPEEKYSGKSEKINLHSKNAIASIVDKWIVELTEITSTVKNNPTAFKAFLTKNTDNLKAPYGNQIIEYPRKTVFITTTAESDFISDVVSHRHSAVIPLDPNLKIDYSTQIEPFDTMQFWGEIWHYMLREIGGETIENVFRL